MTNPAPIRPDTPGDGVNGVQPDSQAPAGGLPPTTSITPQPIAPPASSPPPPTGRFFATPPPSLLETLRAKIGWPPADAGSAPPQPETQAQSADTPEQLTGKAAMEEFLELMKQTPAWQRPGLLPYAPRGDRAEGPVSKVFRSRGGKELLHRLLSDDTTASMQAQRQMLLSEGGFAHLASTVISLELASRMDAEPNMSVAVIQQLVALKAKLVAIQESAFRTAAAVRQGPVHLLLKSSGATQVNVNVNSDDKDDAITLI